MQRRLQQRGVALGVRVEAPVLDEDGQDGGADVAVEGEADVRLALGLEEGETFVFYGKWRVEGF